mmetsp:Transcript_65045/g.128489  ORF Transcript_65045/g.128489 Transcript_65045/m.128489 type:complete len:281 (-) Transcript_65045:42-884(-)
MPPAAAAMKEPMGNHLLETLSLHTGALPSRHLGMRARLATWHDHQGSTGGAHVSSSSFMQDGSVSLPLHQCRHDLGVGTLKGRFSGASVFFLECVRPRCSSRGTSFMFGSGQNPNAMQANPQTANQGYMQQPMMGQGQMNGQQPIGQQPMVQQPMMQQPMGQQPMGQQPMPQQPMPQQPMGQQQQQQMGSNGNGTSSQGTNAGSNNDTGNNNSGDQGKGSAKSNKIEWTAPVIAGIATPVALVAAGIAAWYFLCREEVKTPEGSEASMIEEGTSDLTDET